MPKLTLKLNPGHMMHPCGSVARGYFGCTYSLKYWEYMTGGYAPSHITTYHTRLRSIAYGKRFVCMFQLLSVCFNYPILGTEYMAGGYAPSYL